jgi:hypothetical protein
MRGGFKVFLKDFIPTALVATATCALASCSELVLPRFDGGLLNPDIRLLRAGELMEGSKCAMAAFMHEREQFLISERESEYRVGHGRLHDIETQGGDPKKYFSPYEINVTEPVAKHYKTIGRTCGKNMHYGHALNDDGTEIAGAADDCVANKCDIALSRTHSNLGESVWDYQSTIDKNKTKIKGCTPVPDYSRFALDPTQTASVQLTLTAINTGFIKLHPHRCNSDPLLSLYPTRQFGHRCTVPDSAGYRQSDHNVRSDSRAPAIRPHVWTISSSF